MVIVRRKLVVPSFSVAFLSMIIGITLNSPTPLDAVVAYEKTPLAPTEYIAVNDIPLVTLGSSTGNTLTESLADESDEEKEITDGEVLLLTFAAAEQQPEEPSSEDSTPFLVPFFSQFADISSPSWKKVGCGIASLAMLIEYYEPGSVSVDALLQEGIDANAYLDNAGWTYAGLIGISQKYGLTGETKDFGGSNIEDAYTALLADLNKGPVMASVHYTFVPTNTIPHLVIINGIKDGEVHYNDPAESQGGGTISVAQFKSAWKKRYITFHPVS